MQSRIQIATIVPRANAEVALPPFLNNRSRPEGGARPRLPPFWQGVDLGRGSLDGKAARKVPAVCPPGLRIASTFGFLQSQPTRSRCRQDCSPGGSGWLVKAGSNRPIARDGKCPARLRSKPRVSHGSTTEQNRNKHGFSVTSPYPCSICVHPWPASDTKQNENRG